MALHLPTLLHKYEGSESAIEIPWDFYSLLKQKKVDTNGNFKTPTLLGTKW